MLVNSGKVLATDKLAVPSNRNYHTTNIVIVKNEIIREAQDIFFKHPRAYFISHIIRFCHLYVEPAQ